MEEDLRNHKLQLQQVEAALTTDPTNEELLKLKTDLEEVIELTQDLINTQRDDSRAASKQQGGQETGTSNIRADFDFEMQARLLRRKKWKPGTRCLAKWEQNQHFYDAVVDEIMGHTVRVKFFKYNQYRICHIDELKDPPTTPKKTDEAEEGYIRYVKPHTRDYLKKKKLKKQQRFKQIEEERESEKNKWINFNNKSAKKGSGVKGKSIFASPDNVNGRVGIGTCGISGKPMTEFSHGEMWRKGV